MRLRIYILVFVLALSACQSTENFSFKDVAAAGLDGGAGLGPVSLAGLPVSSIVDKFHQAASQLLFEGEGRGDALMQMAGNQLEVLAQNANIAMTGQQNTLFEHLDVFERSFFTQMNGILKSALESTNKVISILQDANLNLMELTNSLPFTTKRYNYINKIEGLVQIHSDGNYKIKISGLGFGQDLDNVKYAPSIKIDGKTLTGDHLDRVPNFDMYITIPHDLLEPYFKKNSMQSVPLEVDMNTAVATKRALFFPAHDSVHSQWKLKIVLMPLVAGYIIGDELLTGQSLDGNTLTTSVTVQTPDGDAHWDREIKVASNQRIIAVRHVCASGMCRWDYRGRTVGEGADFDILDNGTTAHVYRFTQGPATVIHYADYQTLVTHQDLKPIDTIWLQFGKPIVLKLSAQNKDCAYRLHGKLVTGQEIAIDNSMNESPDKLLTRVGVGTAPEGVACQPTFILSIP